MTQNGIDVSSWQGRINWQDVKENGVGFAIPRAGYGWEDKPRQTDSQFYNNINGAKTVGIPIGCYHYSYATTRYEAKREADFLLDIIQGYQFEYPIFYDLEDKVQRDLGKDRLTEVALSFCEELEQAGYYPAVYCSLDWARSRLDMERLNRYDLWLAQYYHTVTYTGPYTVWQYTSTGRIDGITGNVDLNVCYKDYPSLIKSQGKNGFPKLQPASGYLLLDTKSYTLAPGGIYDIKATLTGADPKNMRVYSSRTGIASVRQLPNGNWRVTGIADGVSYIMFEVYDTSGRQLNHASVKITVETGAIPHGESNSSPSVF